MVVNFLISLILLFVGTQLLVNTAITISNRLNINRIVIGFTIVSLATSLPELFVTLSSSIRGYHDFAIGNIIGSNISNISLVLGVTAIISPIIFSKKELYLNYVPLILISTAFVFILVQIGLFNLLYGVLAILVLISFNIFLFKNGKSILNAEQLEDPNILIFFGKEIIIKKLFYLILILLSGSLILWMGSEMLVNSSKEIALKLGVSDRVISISLVALGTSLPELFSSIYAAYKKETQLAIGNLLGSNIFNMLAVLGVTTCINEISVGNNLEIDAFIMLFITLFLLPCFYLSNLFRVEKNNHNMVISKIEGLSLLIIYVVYIIFVIN
ncbi:MAG: hypothetical protein CMP50_06850 [Flavobacteriales bacterium]|nr:hypothetical protein [Flavobacteriales bacterium]